MEDYAQADLDIGYWCNTCIYFRATEPRSPTGAWCQKLAAPDRAHGCCNYWKRRTPGQQVKIGKAEPTGVD